LPGTLRHLGKYGKLEASFASKLLATIDPNLPVWDKHVLRNTGLKAPSRQGSWETRIEQAESAHYHVVRGLCSRRRRPTLDTTL
jgi:hypothetical protein